jgi:hypothetical protein
MPPCIVLLLFLRCFVQRPKQRDGVPPQAPQPSGLLSNIQAVTAADSRLIVALYPQMAAPQARAQSISLFICVFIFGAPNRQNNHGAAKADGACLA